MFDAAVSGLKGRPFFIAKLLTCVKQACGKQGAICYCWTAKSTLRRHPI